MLRRRAIDRLDHAQVGQPLLTRDDRLAARVRALTTQARGDAVEFVHAELGFNYRLSNLHAALGLAQLEQLEAFVADKRATAAQWSPSMLFTATRREL